MKTCLFFGFVLLLAACNQQQPAQNQDAATVPEPASIQEQPVPPPLPSMGMFTGEFLAVDYDEKKDVSYSNRITIAIESLENGVVKGYSIVAGNSRPFEGTYKEEEEVLLRRHANRATTNTTGFLRSKCTTTAKPYQGRGKPTTLKLGSTSASSIWKNACLNTIQT